MNIQVNVGVGLEPNGFKLATVKEVRYDPCEESTIGREEIYMETTDGEVCNWYISIYKVLRLEEFAKTREDIKAGRIKEGTEVSVIYNKNGILAFVL